MYMSKHVKNSLAIPTPLSINYMWNMGSLLGLCMVVQTASGLFLAIHYLSDVHLAFDSVIHINENVNYGWMVRYIHANGASLFFVFCYIHIGRNLYYESWKSSLTWVAGILILFLLMGTAFLGYVLPWGQMSFWGATVITNLISAIPYFGSEIVMWLWGGYSVGGPTLTRFFSFHFLLPFILIGMIMIHILFLHVSGSSNPLGLEMNVEKIQFHSYFVVKDVVTVIMYSFMLLFMCLECPHIFMDPDNFIPSNPMVTPIHIQPEWYFLFAYAILRCIPSKLGGVLALVMSILILLFIPLFSTNQMKGSRFLPQKKVFFWLFSVSMFMLTYLGSLPVEYPFISLSQIYSLWYFTTIMMMVML